MSKAFSFLGKYWAVITISLLLSALFLGFIAGYRLGPGLTITQLGSVAVVKVPAGTNLFTDLSRQHFVGSTGSTLIRLTPGAHTIIVDAEGFQPWNELFTVMRATTTTLTPILVPVNVRAEELLGTEKSEVNRLIFSTPLPSKQQPLIVGGGCAVVYASGNKIIAEATTTANTSCTPPEFLCESGTCAPTFVHVPAETLRSILAFPKRDDALVVAAGGLIYVIELDPREPQFFAPLFKSVFAAATSWSDTAVAGTDGTKTFAIPLSE